MIISLSRCCLRPFSLAVSVFVVQTNRDRTLYCTPTTNTVETIQELVIVRPATVISILSKFGGVLSRNG